MKYLSSCTFLVDRTVFSFLQELWFCPTFGPCDFFQNATKKLNVAVKLETLAYLQKTLVMAVRARL